MQRETIEAARRNGLTPYDITWRRRGEQDAQVWTRFHATEQEARDSVTSILDHQERAGYEILSIREIRAVGFIAEPEPCDYCGKTTPSGHYYCRDYDRADEEMRDQERRARDEVTSDE